MNRLRNIAIAFSCLTCAATPGPAAAAHTAAKPATRTVQVSLSEWQVQLVPERVPPGPVVFQVTNAGKIPHGFEVEGPRLEQATPQIQPGATTTLAVTLRAGRYEVYCPVGKGSHKMLGMRN